MILAAFIPLLIGTSGNVGAQSATVVIRGLPRGSQSEKAMAVVGRESLVGIVLGLTLGVAVLILAYLLGRDLMVAAVVTFTLVVISVIATIVGGPAFCFPPGKTRSRSGFRPFYQYCDGYIRGFPLFCCSQYHAKPVKDTLISYWRSSVR